MTQYSSPGFFKTGIGQLQNGTRCGKIIIPRLQPSEKERSTCLPSVSLVLSVFLILHLRSLRSASNTEITGNLFEVEPLLNRDFADRRAAGRYFFSRAQDFKSGVLRESPVAKLRGFIRPPGRISLARYFETADERRILSTRARHSGEFYFRTKSRLVAFGESGRRGTRNRGYFWSSSFRFRPLPPSTPRVRSARPHFFSARA